MFRQRKLRKYVQFWSKAMSDRDFLTDLDLCDEMHLPGVEELDDHVKITVDEETIILTYGQYANLYLLIAMFYGRI